MPSWLHRTNKGLLVSVAEADLPEIAANYIEEPNLSGVAGVLVKYWKITGDVISEMDQAEKDTVDISEAAAAATVNRAQAVSEVESSAYVGMELRSLIEVFNKRDNYLINRVTELQGALAAIKASTGAADSIRAAIPASWLATNTRLRPDAVQAYKDEINTGNVDT